MNDKKTFAKIQQEIRVMKKQGANVNYAFRNAEDIFLAAKTLAVGTNWVFTCTEEIREVASKVFLVSTAVATNGEETHTVSSPVEVSNPPTSKTGYQTMSVPQWWGACISYSRKYALQGLFGLSEADADSVADAIAKREERK